MPGWPELLLVVVVLVLLYGHRMVPRIGRDLGEFFKALRGIGRDHDGPWRDQ